MNNRLYGLVALGGVVLSVVGASAFSGGAVTSRLSEQTAALKKQLPGLGIEEHIERGVFSTTRMVKLHFGCVPPDAPAGARKPIELGWRDKILHGPLPGGKSFGLASIDTELLIPQQLAKQAKELLGDKPPLTAHTKIGFGGGFETDVSVPSIKLTSKTHEEVSFSGVTLRVTGQFPMGAGKLGYNASLAPIRIDTKSDDGSLTFDMGALDMTGDVHFDPKAISLLTPFQSEGNIASLTVSARVPNATGAAVPPIDFSLTKIKAKSAATLDKELWSTTSSLSAALTVGQVAIEKVELSSALRRLHAPTYLKLINALIATGLSCDKPVDVKDPTAAFDAVIDDAFVLLTHDPEYAVGPLAVELGGKRAEVSYSVATRGITLQDKGIAFPTLLEKKAVARADAKADLVFIDTVAKHVGTLMLGAGGTALQGSAPPQGVPDPTQIMVRAMVDKFVTQGFLVREGDTVRASIETEAGQLKLNGKPFALPDMLPGGP